MQATITDSVLVALGGLIGVIALLFLAITRFRWHVFAALLVPILLFALLPGIDRRNFIAAGGGELGARLLASVGTDELSQTL